MALVVRPPTSQVDVLATAPGHSERLDIDADPPLARLLNSLRRHKLLLALFLLAGVAIATAVVAFSTPLYTAEAILSIEREKPDPTAVGKDAPPVAANAPLDITQVWAEVAKMQSWAVVDRVIGDLGLMSDPEINPELRSDSWRFDKLVEVMGRKLGTVFNRLRGATGDPARQPDEAREIDATHMKAIQAFLENLDVGPDRMSSLVHVRFTSASPSQATKITNQVVATYLDRQVSAKYDDNRRAIEWLTQTVLKMHDTLVKSENAIAEYRIKENLVETKGSGVNEQQLAEINTQLVAARAAEATAVARLNQVSAISKDAGAASTSPEVVNSPVIQRLKAEQDKLRQELANLHEQYGDRHPMVVRAKAQLRDAQRSMQNEISIIIQSVANEVRVARERTAVLQQQLGSLESKSGSLSQAEVRLRELQREAEANRAVYDSFLVRLKELAARLGAQRPDASLVSAALVPIKPSYPNKPKLYGLCTLGAVLLGLLFVFLLDSQRSSFVSTSDVEKATGLRPLGLVPDFGGRRLPAGNMLRAAGAVYIESVRGILSGLFDPVTGQPVTLLMVTSAVAGEGKSTLALSLARMAALWGMRAVLIDCDLGRPSLHERLQEANSEGLLDLLSGRLQLEDVLRVDPSSGLHYVLCGTPADHPQEYLASRTMGALLDYLRSRYDLVILDSAPALALSDTRSLARHVSDCILVVGWQRTRIRDVLAAINHLNDARCNIFGFVLSRVNLRHYFGAERTHLDYYRNYSSRRGHGIARNRPAESATDSASG
jgi:capsular exopolysaccharide synthesis family protein